VMGCTTRQSRATSNLVFWRLNSDAKLVNLNTSSFMFRRREVRERCGGWDDVRFSADTELMKRITAAFGWGSVRKILNAPYSFQRISGSSIVGNSLFGNEGFLFGVRFIYQEAYRAHHRLSSDFNLRSGNGRRFPAPNVMRKDRKPIDHEHNYDVVIASDFRMLGGSTRSSIEEMLCHKVHGVSQAHFHLHRYDLDTVRSVYSLLSDSLETGSSNVLGHGERASCDLLILRYPPILQHRQRFVPTISAKAIKVIVNQTPMSDYGPDGVVRYDLAKCADNIRHYFGKDAVWHPIGPLVREALTNHHADQLHHICLSDQDWHNIIDIGGWDRGPRTRGSEDRLRIGRHSRDHSTKWPEAPEDILAAYPDRDDVEVHVLGGAKKVTQILGRKPRNWTVYEFGSLHPRDFLQDLDVWIYFANPNLIESFGRTIIEAMAVGVPVILPEDYRPLFQEAALYATPATAVELARKLHSDPVAYDRQVEKAKSYSRANFSYEMHVARLRAAGVGK
jgi:glycosyltransferase involved in cell wall biosynthesis